MYLRGQEGASRFRIFLRIAIGLAIVFFIIPTLIGGWPFKKVPRDKIALSYGGGPVEGQKFQALRQPGSALFFNGFYDKLYEYPVTQRNYIISTRPGEGDVGSTDFVTAPSADGVAMTFEVATYFKLCQEEACLRSFHENIGLKYHAYDDGPGWEQMLNDSFRQQIENALQRESRAYSTAELYFSATVLREVQNGIGVVLKENVNEVLGDQYFCGPTYVPGSGECPDFEFIIKKVAPFADDIRAAFEEVRKSEILVQVRENEVEQATLQAEAIRELTQNNNLTPEYVILKAIEAGLAPPSFAPFLRSLSFGG